MGRSFDHTARNTKIIDATWQLLARDGLEGLSVRKVAAQAGLPPSSLRYTFPSIAALRERAARLIIERMLARVAAIRSEGQERALALLFELIPLDVTRRIEMEAFLALSVAARNDTQLERCYQEAFIAIRTVCAEALKSLDDAILASSSATTLATLHALVDGIAMHLLRQPAGSSNEWAKEALFHYMSGLATHQQTCRKP